MGDQLGRQANRHRLLAARLLALGAALVASAALWPDELRAAPDLSSNQQQPPHAVRALAAGLRPVLRTVPAQANGQWSALHAAPAVANGQLRVVHLATERPPLDVLVGEARVFAALAPGRDTGYLVLPAGTHSLAATPEGSPPALTPRELLHLNGGEFHTLLLLPSPAAPLLLQDESLAATGGPARVRLVHGAAGIGSVELAMGGGPPLVADLPFGTASDYQDAPAGTRPLLVRAAGTDTTLATIPDATLAADYSYTFVVVGAEAPRHAIVPLVDAYPPLRAVGELLPPAGATFLFQTVSASRREP